jgi:hypothetical protein
MSNVLNEGKKQQVIVLGKLGWPLRRIEQATGVRRETLAIEKPKAHGSGNLLQRRRLAELLFWEWAADNWVGNQHVKFFLARYASDDLGVHRTSSQSYKDMNNLFLFAMLAVNRNF